MPPTPTLQHKQYEVRIKSLDLSFKPIIVIKNDVHEEAIYENRPIIHESPFNLQPSCVLGCKGKELLGSAFSF